MFKASYILILIMSTFISTWFAWTWEVIAPNKENNISQEQFMEYKEFLKDENARYRENIESSYSKYVDIVREIKGDLLWYLGLIWLLISIIWWVIWFLLQKLTMKTINSFIENEISQTVTNKLDNVNSELDAFFESQKYWIKKKKILYIKTGSNDETDLLKKQGFSSIDIQTEINDSIKLYDLVLIDAYNSSITDNEIEVLFRKKESISAKIPVILFREKMYDRTLFVPEFLGFANTRFTLYTNLFGILNVSSTESELTDVTTTTQSTN